MKRESKCILLAICFLGIFVEELYFCQVYQNSPFIVAGGMAVLLVVAFLLLQNLLQLREQWQTERAAAQEELWKRLVGELSNKKEDNVPKLNNVEKFEKAIYVSLQQGGKMIQEEFEKLDQHLAGDFEALREQIKESAERNAKIDVKYGRENTKSLMVFQKKAFDNVVSGMEEMVKEISSMTEQLNCSVTEIRQAMQEFPVGMPVSSTSFPAVSAVEEPKEAVLEDSISEEVIQEELNLEETVPEEAVQEELNLEETVPEEVVQEELNLEEIMPEEPTQEEVKEELALDPNRMMTPEEIAALVAGGSATEESKVEEVKEEPAADPNRMMTPEEIAALVAGGSATEEPKVEEVKEEPAPDPNRMMTPEEIAALIAGTN